eukprot:2628873-Rhodomonas_salina.2
MPYQRRKRLFSAVVSPDLVHKPGTTHCLAQQRVFGQRAIWPGNVLSGLQCPGVRQHAAEPRGGRAFRQLHSPCRWKCADSVNPQCKPASHVRA